MANEPDVEFLDIEDLIALAVLLLGDPPPIRDIGLLGSAVARPATTVLGDDAYPDIWSKAAALFQSIVKNYALVDGNKRLGWLATAVFLEINGVEIITASNDDIYDLVFDVAAGHQSVDEIASALPSLIVAELIRPNHSRRGTGPPSPRTSDRPAVQTWWDRPRRR